MKKLLFILLLPIAIFGQAINSIPDSLSQIRADIDTNSAHILLRETKANHDTLVIDVNTNASNILLRETKANHDTLATDVGTNTSAIATNTAKVSYPGSADATELDILDGATLTTTELNYVDDVTGPIQTQLDSKIRTDYVVQSISPRWRMTDYGGFGWASAGGTMGIPYEITPDLSDFDALDGLYFFMIDYTNSKLVIMDKVYGTIRNVYFFNEHRSWKLNFQYPQDEDTQFLFETDFDVTIDSVRCINESHDATYDSTSFQVLHGGTYSTASRVFTATNYVTESPMANLVSESFTSGFNDRTIDAGDEVWVYFDDVVGSPKNFQLTIYYTRD